MDYILEKKMEIINYYCEKGLNLPVAHCALI